ncbi:MAG: metal ABC transporter substrate-binding protein [Coriobacteriales bacterium]|nr:metal ABC transporter substrate-binding protein [Coriobacteriales bacterium]
MRRPWYAVLAALALCALVLAGCAGKNASDDVKTKIVCTTFPAYDWTMQVLGNEADQYEVTYLLGSGVDLHSYQPTVADMARVSNADLFVYVGGESDAWAQDAIVSARNPNLHALSLLEVVGDSAVEEEEVEGMEAPRGEHEHEEEGEEEDEAPELDEHVWLSLRHAQTITRAIADELADIDPANADAFAANAQAYCNELAQLDERYTQAIDAAPHDTLVFADRFPFRYLTDDYGLSYYAAFAGCSAETEASFNTVMFLANKLDELGLDNVLVIDGSNQRMAQTVIRSTRDKDQHILVLDSLQSTKDKDIQAGKTYLHTMEDNLHVLTNALA